MLQDEMGVLVTGGAGFLGSHLCDRLVAEGVDVVCADNLFTGRRSNIRHLLDNLPYKDMRPVEIEIPPRQEDEGYKRPKMSSQRFVREVY